MCTCFRENGGKETCNRHWVPFQFLMAAFVQSSVWTSFFDCKRANLRDPRVQAQWLEFVWAGKVHALYVGPPCESWSRARALGGLPNETCGDGGPRVLRTSVSPQGLSTLRVEEVKQLIVANQLLHFCTDNILCDVDGCQTGGNRTPCNSGWGTRGVSSIYLAVVGYKKRWQTTGRYNWSRCFKVITMGCHRKPTNLLIAAGPQINAQEFLDAKRTRSTLLAALKMTQR